MPPLIEVSIHYGAFGEKNESVAIRIPEELRLELMEPFEYDPQPLFDFLPGKAYKNQTVVARKKLFNLRRDQARKLATEIERKLLELFGTEDTLHGYKIKSMHEDEVKYHKERGRL